jgi:hypothetical protein
MAEQNSAGGGSFPLNLNTLLVVLTLASSVWLVSQKLTSTRPAPLAGMSREFPGEQTVEARLWEDPFKTPEQHSKGDNPTGTDLTTLLTSIERKAKAQIQLLPVLLSGGAYSENQESRVRSRFAIVSALGQSGYDPEDAEHIGSAMLAWPTTQALDTLKQNAQERPQLSFAELWLQQSFNTTTPSLDLRYEWYRLRPEHLSIIADPSSADSSQSNIGIHRNKGNTSDLPLYVLVLWLDERYFEDEPLLRLPLLLEPIMQAVSKSGDAPLVTLIGPVRSSTLRKMLPDWQNKTVSLGTDYPALWPKITKILNDIQVYSATARAMDAVLVQDSHDGRPREKVGKELQEIGFKSFQNFVATDDQLASEMLSELALRNVNFEKQENHLVLLYEGDNFYARALSLTYAAELAMCQGHVNSRADFVKSLINRQGKPPNNLPTNLHSFVYLRGLDGQTVGNDSESARRSDTEKPTQASPMSLEDLRKWSPDANKAEGSAQFDYLNRLGDRLADLEKELSKKDHHIRAIGVVGTDVYDTLLILQALRPQFPETLFFTTGLEASLWHPREQSWSRNLLVTSGYGLSLHPLLQGGVMPFRDSTQTAQFAATLAALGHAGLRALQYVPPRRFEIGKHYAVDLSVPSPDSGASTSVLHPLRTTPPLHLSWVVIGVTGSIAVLLLTCFFGPLRRLTWDAPQFQAELLRYREEDLGGVEGTLILVSRLHKLGQERTNGLGRELVEAFNRAKLDGSLQWSSADAMPYKETPVGGAPPHDYTAVLEKIKAAKQRLDSDLDSDKEAALQEIDSCKETLLRGMLDFLNRLLPRRSYQLTQGVDPTSMPCTPLQAEYQCWWQAQQGHEPRLPASPRQLRHGRGILDESLQIVVEEPGQSYTSMESDILHKAKTARDASLGLYTLQRRWVCQFWILAGLIVVLAIVLGVRIWQDTVNPRGELFSLTTGTSAWPGEILRFAALALAISFSFHSYYSLRTMMLQLTRRFRLPLASNAPSPAPAIEKSGRAPVQRVRPWQRFKHRVAILLYWWYDTCGLPAPPEPGASVHASQLWETYQRYGIFRRRLCRILCLLIPYFGCCWGIWLLSHQDMLRPLRGATAMAWDVYLTLGAPLSFLFLTFMTIDATRLCRWFIKHLTGAPTDYPLATTNHFSRLRGDVDRRYLDEWIDLQLIADLTERVSRLVYYPSIIFFLLLLARNEWWNRWPWPWALIIIFVSNFALAAISVILLQNAARQAKREAEATLEAKVKRLQAVTAESQAKNNANQTEKLLEEIRNLRRGAFVPFWENPVLGAVLLPSSGTAVLTLLVWFTGH